MHILKPIHNLAWYKNCIILLCVPSHRHLFERFEEVRNYSFFFLFENTYNNISISFKISKILSRFGFKVSFRPVNKINFFSPKDPIPIENRSGIYFISCAPCNFGCIGLTRRLLKARLNKHRRKIKNEEIFSSSIASHCWP